ncbi:MAG TPA: hypothetical protein VLJ59_01905 [Mycobacteriales bacterium]|nr:hypothetical protein [Mycobacteriales bacterium]
MTAPTALPATLADDLLSPVDPTPDGPTWWANGLLAAVAAADTSPAGDPVLAAAGHAATVALLLLQHHGGEVGTTRRADLREVYAVSVDQLAILRELLRYTPGAMA